MRNDRMRVRRSDDSGRRRTRKPIYLFLAGIVTVIWLGVYLSNPGNTEEPVVIQAGESTGAIVARLKEQGVIRSGLLFKYALWQSGKSRQLQPGSHDLSGTGSYREIIERMSSGLAAANEHKLTVIEGWTLREISEALDDLGLPSGESLSGVAGESAVDYRNRGGLSRPDFFDEYAFLADLPEGASLEGYLFPDTYRLFVDADAEEVVRTFLSNFGNKLDENISAEIRASGRPLHDYVIMASIIEREVRDEMDRHRVSDLFWRRLDVGMALQADSTVNYVTGKSLAAVTREDTQVDSPYNTYRYPGLPLGPISNPGIESLRAAVFPAPNDYWYFLTDLEGNVHYAKTLDGHNANKARYLK